MTTATSSTSTDHTGDVTPEPAAARLRLVAFAVVVVAATVFFLLNDGLSREAVETRLDDLGIWAPVVYVVAYAVLTVLFFPGSVLTVVGGVVFGSVQGTVLTVVGATIGATAAFLVGRRIGRSSVRALAGDGVERVDDWLTRRGLVAVLYTRLLPILPFNALNYISGVTGLRLRDYVIGTFLGIIPATFAFSSLGGNIDDLSSPQFLGSVALIVVLLASGPFLSRRLAPDEVTEDE